MIDLVTVARDTTRYRDVAARTTSTMEEGNDGC